MEFTFTPLERSLCLTLCGRALDSRSHRPILADATAVEIVERIGGDLDGFPLPENSVRDIALRALKLDAVVRDFIARHPDAVVLDLGAGLDGRAARIDPPRSVAWYDVDFPGVIAARKQVVPRSASRGIGADVTAPGWLAELPRDRPVVAVADGLLAFLAQDDFVALLKRITDHFPAGEIAFNGYTRFHVWALKRYKGTGSIADLVVNPGFDDPHDPERWNPRLRLIEEILLARAPEVDEYPWAMRWFTRCAALSTAISRRGTTVLRYGFGTEPEV